MNFRALIVFAAIAVQAQSSQRAALAARQWQNAHETEILQQFTTLLSIPNVASDRENIQRNAELLKSILQKRGVDSRLLTVEGALTVGTFSPCFCAFRVRVFSYTVSPHPGVHTPTGSVSFFAAK
jgi:hypothetical protein